MISYSDKILKSVKKGQLTREIFVHFNNAFISLDKTNDFELFDIKRLKTKDKRAYYRLRKGKYRSIFYIENKNFCIIAIDKREEVYKKWV